MYGSIDASEVSKAGTRDVVALAPQLAGTCHVLLARQCVTLLSSQ